MFIKYNAVLRGLPGKVPCLKASMERLCADNRYVTTLHVINSAIVKMGKLMVSQKVYRGIAGGLLPPEFWEPNEFKVPPRTHSSRFQSLVL